MSFLTNAGGVHLGLGSFALLVVVEDISMNINDKQLK